MLNSSASGNSETRLGNALRQRRKELGLTMQQVAKAAGLSTGFISQVERDLTAPSLSSLAALAEALQTPMSAFLTQPDSNAPATHKAERSAFSVPGAQIRYERLSTKFAGSTLHSVISHEPPGYRSEPISHPGEELFYVLSGEITVEIEGTREVLRAGDSVHFDSNRTHSSWVHDSQPATILWCGTMDVFGSQPSPMHSATAPTDAPSTSNLSHTAKTDEKQGE